MIEFYHCILQQLLIYATNQEEPSSAFIRVLETLLNQVSTDVTRSDSLSYLENKIETCTIDE